MFGAIELEQFEGLTSMPQDYASAWHSLMDDLIGASYKPLLCLGKQIVNGVHYFFIAEQTLITNPPVRRVVKIVITQFGNRYEIVSIEEI